MSVSARIDAIQLSHYLHSVTVYNFEKKNNVRHKSAFQVELSYVIQVWNSPFQFRRCANKFIKEFMIERNMCVCFVLRMQLSLPYQLHIIYVLRFVMHLFYQGKFYLKGVQKFPVTFSKFFVSEEEYDVVLFLGYFVSKVHNIGSFLPN